MLRNEKQLAGAARSAQPSGQERRAAYERAGVVAVLAAAATFGLAACTGGSGSPSVASLGTSTTLGKSSGNGSTSTTSARPSTDATQSLDEWAACMRSHGDPNQADPTVDANKVIHISWNGAAIPGGIYGTDKGGQGDLGPGQYCRAYLSAAQAALGNGPQTPQPNQAQLLKYSQCMRANGVADYPDPTNGGVALNLGAGGDLNPNNPTFKSASKVCGETTGVYVPGGQPPPGAVELNGAIPGSDMSGANSGAASGG
jgi:hypothetical protein